MPVVFILIVLKTTFLFKALFFFVSLCCASSFAQSPDFTVIQNGLASGDSSYYDVCRVTDDEFWAIGKKGVITKFGKNGTSDIKNFPGQGVDLLNMTVLDEDNYILCGDKGFIYQFNKSSGIWNVLQVKGYENSCFYTICAIDENNAYLSGGRSKIASSQRVIPFGFILKTEDGGKTWKRVFKSVSGMVWSVKYDRKADKVLALVYTPVKTRLISSSDHGDSWVPEAKKISGLFHDFKLSDGKLILAGGKNGNFRKNGTVLSGNDQFLFENSGIFWDVESSGNLALASGSGGNLLFKHYDDTWKLVHSPVNNNLYEICFIDEKSAFLVGNSKTIIKVDFK